MTSAMWLVLSIIVLGLSLRELILMRKTSGFTYNDKTLPEWEKGAPQVAANHMQVVGVLAGFSITVAILTATLGEKTQLPPTFLHQVILGMLMVSFFGYIGAGLVYSVVVQRLNLHRFFLFSAAGLLYYVSAMLSFCALLPLLDIVGTAFLRLPVMLLVVSAVIGGYMAHWIPLFDLMRLRLRLCLALFLLAASMTGVYLSLGYYWPLLHQRELAVALGLLASLAVISLTFVLCMLSFYYQRLAQETVLTWVAILMTGAGIAAVVYFSSIIILLIRP